MRRRWRPETDAELIAYNFGRRIVSTDDEQFLQPLLHDVAARLALNDTERAALARLDVELFWQWAHAGHRHEIERRGEVD